MKAAVKQLNTPNAARAKRSTAFPAPRGVLATSAPTVSIPHVDVCACGGGCPRCATVVQPKLTVGSPDDRYEQEADRIADEVMRMPEPALQRQSVSPEFEEELEDFVQAKPLADQITPLVQRQVEPEEEEEEELLQTRPVADQPTSLIQRQTEPEEEEEEEIQTKLEIGPANGRYEREADRVADAVMRTKATVPQVPAVTSISSTTAVLQRSPSRVIPDLEDTTVDEMSRLLPLAIADRLRQELINMIVADRRRKGANFGIMVGGAPRYVSAYPAVLLRQGLSPNANGVTVASNSPPVNPANQPLVLIGPMALGTSRDPLNHRLVRLYSTIMHEYQHVLQRLHPARARAMTEHQREVEAFFWEIENSRRTGLFQQRGPFGNIWDEALRHWRAFEGSPAWNRLSRFERARYMRWYARVSEVVIAALGPQVVHPVRRQPDTGQTEGLLPSAGPGVTADLEPGIKAMRGHGRPLSEAERAFFEPRFGCGFSHVRVHTDAKAAEAARSLRARAFTVGSDIVFGEGQHAPPTDEGKELIAHELTHVVQQSTTQGLHANRRPLYSSVAKRSRQVSETRELRVQRTPPSGVSFSVETSVLTLLERRVARAVSGLERLATTEHRTFARWMAPLLRQLSGQITYRDSGGTDHDGGSLDIGFRGSRQRFDLRLVLDDQPNPIEKGYFQPTADYAGRIALNIRPQRRITESGGLGTQPQTGTGLVSQSVDDIASTLYHEALHLFFYWMRTVGAQHLPFSEQERSRLTVSRRQSTVRHRAEIDLVARNVGTLISDVNRARRAGASPRSVVPAGNAGPFAERLAEEAVIRGETLFMEQRRTRRRAIEGSRFGTSPVTLPEAVARERGESAAGYLFVFDDMLTRADRAGLSRSGQEAYARIRRLLGEITYRHARMLWAFTEYETFFP